MSKPIGYYASAARGTKDNAILSEIESNYGSWLEKLTPSQKSAWAIALLTEAVEPEGASVDFCIDKPILSSLFNLSDGCKLDLAVAVLTKLARIRFIKPTYYPDPIYTTATADAACAWSMRVRVCTG